MADLKSLKIKTGICKRVMKEMQSYEAEAEREFAKVENMKKNHADPSDIKQQVALEIKFTNHHHHHLHHHNLALIISIFFAHIPCHPYQRSFTTFPFV